MKGVTPTTTERVVELVPIILFRRSIGQPTSPGHLPLSGLDVRPVGSVGSLVGRLLSRSIGSQVHHARKGNPISLDFFRLTSIAAYVELIVRLASTNQAEPIGRHLLAMNYHKVIICCRTDS